MKKYFSYVLLCFIVILPNLYSQNNNQKENSNQKDYLAEIIHFPQNYIGRDFSFKNVKLSPKVTKEIVNGKEYYSLFGIKGKTNFGGIDGQVTFVTSPQIAQLIVRQASKKSDWLGWTTPCTINFKIYRINSLLLGDQYYALIYNIKF